MHGLCAFGMFVGRILLSLVFLWSGVSKLLHWDDALQLITANQLPMGTLALGITCAIELLGGLSLIFGFKARWGALLLILLMIPVTLIFHDFWSFEGAEAHVQKIFFIKNLSLIGGLFYVLSCGAGSWGCDRCSHCEGR